MNYKYSAKNTEGVHVEGRIDAPSEDQAVILLQQKGFFVLSVSPEEAHLLKKDLSSYFSRPSNKDLVSFTRQLATLIDADVPLLEGLGILGHQTEKESFRAIINTVRTSIEGGATLSVALSEHIGVFGQFYISLVRVGEVTGKLQESLLYLAEYLERISSLNSKIRGALFYPAFVLFAMVVVGVVLMTTVIPQLISIIKDAGVEELPLTTRMLIAVSEFMESYFVYILIAVVMLIIGVLYYVRTEEGRKVLDRLKISVPRFGRIVRNLYIARFSETLATLIRSGVPILEGIDITSDVVGNQVYREILLEAKTSIKGGSTLSDTLQRYPHEFPRLVSSMVMTGEKTGRTEYMLTTLQKFYKVESENDIQNLSQLIEPVMIIILGLGIGGLVSAVLLPIYSLVNVG